ncbi:Mur ligase family protein [Candidatus Saccharibacteria bacterium]|nr:Mur ligase family protein [Candidatus Saccharibacteria bacterium]
MLRKWISGYNLVAYLYMLQQVEYSTRGFVRWWGRAKDFGKVERRQKLKWTGKIRILAVFTIIVAVGVAPLTLAFGPILLPAILLLVNAGFNLAQKPVEIHMTRRAARILMRHDAKKIVVLGSYGKTTAKEVLATVFCRLHSRPEKRSSQGATKEPSASADADVVCDVKATYGNENTLLGIARFARKLKGNEKVLIFELGEFRFGDVRKLCKMIRPDYAVYTGVSGAHLDTLGDLDGVVRTLNEAREFVLRTHIAVNADNKILRQQPAEWYFSEHGVNSSKITGLQLSYDGSRFSFLGLRIKSPLLGRHNIAIVAFAVFFASRVLNMKPAEITKNLEGLEQFPHRMATRWVGESLVIDDTYNGNLEGVRAGLELMENLPFKNKVYVTPGLVEQGKDNAKTHERIGEMIARSGVTKVYFMQNSVERYMRKGLKKVGFKGEVITVQNPLDFYENLAAIAVGDQVILLQNDWGDGYA